MLSTDALQMQAFSRKALYRSIVGLGPGVLQLIGQLFDGRISFALPAA
jgi:hypothetical protein